MLPFDPLVAVAPLGAAAALASSPPARRLAALAAAAFALGAASLGATLALAGEADLAGVPALSLRIDAGLELIGLVLAAAAAITVWRSPRRDGDRVAAALLLASVLLIGVAALPPLRAALTVP